MAETSQVPLSSELAGNAQLLGARETQQDYFALFSVAETTVALLADGMGGHAGGELASEQAIKAFKQALQATTADWSDIPRLLQTALKQTNQRLAELQRQQPALADMGTTLIALVLTDAEVWWLSVGDSPLYRLHHGTLARLNANHSPAEALQRAVQAGELTQAEALADPDYHALLSSVSGTDIPLIDCPEHGLVIQEHDRFLLASDGIHTVSEDAIESLFGRASSAQAVAESLTDAVNRQADEFQDNCTVVVLFNGDPPPPRTLPALKWLGILLLCVSAGAMLYFNATIWPGWSVSETGGGLDNDQAHDNDAQPRPGTMAKQAADNDNNPFNQGVDNDQTEQDNDPTDRDESGHGRVDPERRPGTSTGLGSAG